MVHQRSTTPGTLFSLRIKHTQNRSPPSGFIRVFCPSQTPLLLSDPSDVGKRPVAPQVGGDSSGERGSWLEGTGWQGRAAGSPSGQGMASLAALGGAELCPPLCSQPCLSCAHPRALLPHTGASRPLSVVSGNKEGKLFPSQTKI